MAEQNYASRFVAAPDGLRLHYRDYGSASSGALPVVCLPGLTRTTADFHRLATVLSADGHRVVTLDLRGRGLSAHDPEPKNYNLGVESADVVAVLASAGVTEAVFVGTSRGGLITMILAATQPRLIRGAVLNDIGPVIEPKGLARIRSYVGQLPQPKSWDDIVVTLKHVAGEQFTALSDAEWRFYAELTFEETDDGFRLLYDPALMLNLSSGDVADIPSLWPQFEALRPFPVLVVRGENSDLLSVETVGDMMALHPGCRRHDVPGQGHAPFLNDRPTITAIADLVRRCTPSGQDQPAG